MTADRSPVVSQEEVIAFLASPDTWHQPVERIDTHSAVIFLVGDRALKMKRAVQYSYLDFTTLARRQAACEAEVALNRRTAPRLYRGTVAVREGSDGHLSLTGDGPAVEWLVEMTRFGQDRLLDRLASRGLLDLSLMSRLADAVADFHQAAHSTRDYGGVDGIVRVVGGTASGLREQGRGVLEPAQVDLWERLARDAASRQRDLLESRRRSGFVRQCHGDLHLRNLVLLDATPTLFDAIEFNDDLACIDVWYDLAFLLMDLAKRGLEAHANVVMNRYLRRTRDDGGLPSLPLFLSCRAGVRAMTSATSARLQPGAAAQADLHDLARQYLALACDLLTPPAPRLVAIGGFSGSGKSTLARAVAPRLAAVPGAVLVRSDEVRKALCGVPDDVALGPDGYRPDITTRVYDELASTADRVLRAGRPVVLDAVFGREGDRAIVERLARERGVPFSGLWLDAPPEVLRRRVAARTHDVSDANAAVIDRQIRTPLNDLRWSRLDGNLPPEEVLRRAEAVLRVGR